MPGRERSVRLGVWAVVALALCGVAVWASEPAFTKPSPQEALKFLQSMPRVNRNNPPSFVPRFKGERYFVQLFKGCSVQDIKEMKSVHPGGHVEDPPGSGKFSVRHTRIKPSDWKYFTVFEQLEEFDVAHDMENITDECLFYLGQLPQTMRVIRLEMSEATGEGVKYLQKLENLKVLSLNFSGTIRDVALVHAGGIGSLEYLDVNGCPRITGTGVKALARLENLKTLKIGGTSLSDASLVHFKALAVEELDLSDNVGEWVTKRHGGGEHRFTVSFAGLKSLIASKDALPHLKRLKLSRNLPGWVKPAVKSEPFSKAQKAELAKLRPGLEVR